MTQPTSPAQRKPRFRERNALKEQRKPAARPAPSPPPPSRPRPRSQVGPPLRSLSWPAVTTEQALYAAILVAGFALRIWDVGSRAMHGDESVHAWLAWNLYSGAGYQYDPVYHGPLQF